MVRLKEVEKKPTTEASIRGSETGEENKCPRLLPRPSFGILFEYARDCDKRGVIFWIATNRGRGTHACMTSSSSLCSFFACLKSHGRTHTPKEG